MHSNTLSDLELRWRAQSLEYSVVHERINMPLSLAMLPAAGRPAEPTIFLVGHAVRSVGGVLITTDDGQVLHSVDVTLMS